MGLVLQKNLLFSVFCQAVLSYSFWGRYSWIWSVREANRLTRLHSCVFFSFPQIFLTVSSYFNYRSTAYLIKHGFYSFLNWFDSESWYPLGRIVGSTVFPGIMWTAAAFYHVLDALNLTLTPVEICGFELIQRFNMCVFHRNFHQACFWHPSLLAWPVLPLSSWLERCTVLMARVSLLLPSWRLFQVSRHIIFHS